MSASWFLVSMYLIWILDVSHRRTSAFSDHLDHSFIVLKHNTIKLLDAKIGRLRNKVNIIQNIEHSSRLHLRVACVTTNNGFHRSIMILSRDSQEVKQSDPINQVR